MKPVVIGPAFGPGWDGGPALGGVCGRRLARLVGDEALGARFDALNLVERFPGRGRSGDQFPLAEARQRAYALRPSLEGRKVVLLGANAARAFGLPAKPFCVWRRDGFEYAVVPHPSGLNRWWNDPEHVESARICLLEALC